jgi:hypothetical protein
VNNISEGKYDFGLGFERDAFNVIVNDDNAGTVVINFPIRRSALESIQQNFINFIINNGGSAEKYQSMPDLELRPNYDAVEKYLRKEITNDQLKQIMGC